MKPSVKSHHAKPSFRYFSRYSCDSSISLYLTGKISLSLSGFQCGLVTPTRSCRKFQIPANFPANLGQAFLIQGPCHPASRAAFALHDVIPVADCLTVKGAKDVINKPLAFEINLHRSVHDVRGLQSGGLWCNT